jgi:hypothetical protein
MMQRVPRSFQQDKIRARVQDEIARAQGEAKKKENGARAVFNERRSTVRVPVRFAARYGQQFPAEVTEISKSGLRLRTTEELKIGSAVEIDILFGRGFSPSVLHVRAHVARHIADDGDGHECGLKVVSDAATKAALGAAVLKITLSTVRTK